MKNFLVDIKLEQTVNNSTVIGNKSGIASTTAPDDDLDRVIYAYVVVGLVTVLCGVPALVWFVCHGDPRPCLVVEQRRGSIVVAKSPDGSRRNSVIATTGLTDQTPHRRQRTTVLRRRGTTTPAFLCVFILFFVGFFCGSFATIPRSFLTAFAIYQLLWSSNDAAELMSVLGAAISAGRVIGVPISALVPPIRLLIGQAVLSAVGLITLFVAGSYSSTPAVVVWISVVVIGLGMSTISVLLLLTLLDTWRVDLVGTDTMSATFGVGACIGSATAAMLVGYVTDFWTPMCLVYFTAGFLGCMLAVLGIGLIVGGRLQRLVSTTTDYNSKNEDAPMTETTPLFRTDN